MLSIHLQVAIKRAKCVARKSIELAIHYLRQAGVAFESAFAAAARYAASVA